MPGGWRRAKVEFWWSCRRNDREGGSLRESMASIWKPFRGSSELEAIGLLLFGRTAGHGELLLERFALKNFTIGLAKEFVFLCANVFS